jgi:FkbM family methyltransferase
MKSMIRNTIRKFLNKRNYEIIKQPYRGDRYPNLSKNADEYYCETPIGNFYLPVNADGDPVTSTIVRGKYFEEEIIHLAKKYIQKGTVVLDVGANFGQMAIAFSKMVGDDGKVYAFEAQDTVFKFLEKNIQANKCTNVIAKDGAVYNEVGKILIFPEPELSNISFSSNAINPQLSSGRKVTTFTIDSLQINEPISFIKVDIQGSDIFAMQGAKETILKNKMPILFEFEQPFQSQFGTTFQDYVDFVNEIDYKFTDVINNINFLITPK